MLPVDLFRRPVFALSVATAVCVHAAAMITLITLSFYFRHVEGLSPIEIGVLITPCWRCWSSSPAGRTARRSLPGRIVGRPGASGHDRRPFAGAVHARTRHLADIAWRMAVCGIGFGFFQSPNNRLLIGSAPPDRAGAGSGMVSTARLVGQTTGSALVAVAFGMTHDHPHPVVLGMHVAIGVAAGFAALGTALSWARLANR